MSSIGTSAEAMKAGTLNPVGSDSMIPSVASLSLASINLVYPTT